MNSEADSMTLRAMAAKANILTVANGSDWKALALKKQKRNRDEMIFVGNLAYPPNAEAVRWFATEILPKIRQKRPSARFKVVGGGASADLRALRGVDFAGFAQDMRPHLWSAGLAVCPVRLAAGRQNKILDAFASGLPVVATSLTARGCEAEPGRHLLTADSAEDFAAASLSLISQPALAKRLAAQALGFVRARYDWAKSAGKIEKILKEISR
jgi:glycosyltransferase involved in cell wall biosynthesis